MIGLRSLYDLVMRKHEFKNKKQCFNAFQIKFFSDAIKTVFETRISQFLFFLIF